MKPTKKIKETTEKHLKKHWKNVENDITTMEQHEKQGKKQSGNSIKNIIKPTAKHKRNKRKTLEKRQKCDRNNITTIGQQ